MSYEIIPERLVVVLEPINAGEVRCVIGFDAYFGPYVSLPRLANVQRLANEGNPHMLRWLKIRDELISRGLS